VKKVEEVEIHTLNSYITSKAMARHLFDSVRRGEAGLCSLRQISILLHRNIRQGNKAGIDLIDALKGRVKMPLEYRGLYPIQIRHRWTHVKRDQYVEMFFMTAEGSPWSYWAP
jgi:hypothetical protein